MRTRRSSCAVVALALAVAIAAASLLLLRAPGAADPSGSTSAPAVRSESNPRSVELDSGPAERLPIAELPTDPPDSTPEPAQARRRVVLTGRVTDADGRPLEGTHARIHAAPASGKEIEAIPRLGTYAFEPLEPGEWSLRCSVPGYRVQSRRIALRAGEPEHREDFVLVSEWTIAVRLVTDEGEEYEELWTRWEVPPVSEVEVLAAKGPPGERLSPGSPAWRSARRMSRQSKVGETKVLTVFAEPPITVFAVAAGVVLASEPIEIHVDALTLVIPTKSLRGLACGIVVRLTDADTGAPLPGIVPFIFRPQGSERSAFTATDAQGFARAENLSPGPCTIGVQVADYAVRLARFDLEPGTTNDLGTIALERGVSLNGRFVGPDGRGMSCDASLDPFFDSEDAGSISEYVQLGVTPGDDGAFVAEKLNRGKYVLLARGLLAPDGMPAEEPPAWRSAPVLVDLTEGNVEELEIPVFPAVEVRFETAEALVRDLQVHVVDGQGLSCARASFPRTGYARALLVPGRYEALVGDGQIVKRISFKVGERSLTVDVDR